MMDTSSNGSFHSSRKFPTISCLFLLGLFMPILKTKKSLPLDEPVAGTISDETFSFICRFDLARL